MHRNESDWKSSQPNCEITNWKWFAEKHAKGNKKYVFDSISIRDIPSYKNTYKLNSIVSGEIVFIGYNINNKTNVILVDSLNLQS